MRWIRLIGASGETDDGRCRGGRAGGRGCGDGAAETGPTGPTGPMGAGYRATRKRQWELNHNVATAAGAGG